MLYQKSVINKYLKGIEVAKVEEAWTKFTTHFHNQTIQDNIRNSKEEQYQGEFLIDLFVKVLGYTKNPNPDFNLTTELKNVRGAKKTDGAILKDGKALAVIELKGTKTTDLAKVENQAFGYKNNQPDCIYVITSNFEKLRFYIDNAVDFEEFNLFQLTRDQFNLLWVCLSSDYLLKDIPKKIKEESLTQEENITKKLYKDYSQFRNEVFDSIQQLNPTYDKLTLFKKTQKLLDRFLFIFFAEDRLLVPPNSINQIIEKWKDDVAFGDTKPLYAIFRQYFNVLNTGRPASGKRAAIFAYNGGLFAKDEILDNILIDDKLLSKHTQTLSNYDFQSEVSVNILGHIFEHSLNEIEEIQAELEGVAVDKKKSKRKKDGVFYTPKYITKYIVDNTVGKLCKEKKEALEIDETEYDKKRKGRNKATLKALAQKLEDYRNWLLSLTICDPACGSGAFLNQALEFLIAEHRYIDELTAKLLNESLVLSDVQNDILENNLFGVDINEESVEIAKLSLWLRTAKQGRKLTTLSDNIKCGNSLIDEPLVAGEKAFKWEKEFPTIFEKGGFDVVIGNPPYVNSKGETINDNFKKYLTKAYSTAAYQIDLYILFLELSLKIINDRGKIAFIVPNTWLNNLLLKPVRNYMLQNANFSEFVSMPSNTFNDANVDTIITSYYKCQSDDLVELLKCSNSEFIKVGIANQSDWLNSSDYAINIHITKGIKKILDKVENNSVQFGDFSTIIRGVGVYHKRVGHTKEFIASDPFQSKHKEDESFVPYLRGRNLGRWLNKWDKDSYIKYGNWLAEPRKAEYFDGERILVRKILSGGIIATYINTKFVVDQQLYTSIINENNLYDSKEVLAIVCSKFMTFYFRYKYSEFDDLFPQIKLSHVKSLPIANSIKNGNKQLRLLSNSRIKNTEQKHDILSKLLLLIQNKFDIQKPSSKLQSWYNLEFGGFLKELKKKKIKLNLSEEAEWMQYFNEQKEKAQAIQTEIEQTDKAIDKMVYELYELTEEEIKIVEEATT